MNIKDWRGIRNLVAAELQTDTTAAITWGTPFPVCAVSKLTKNTESSTASKHYSNRSALHRRSRGADEVSIDASGITDATRARIMGEVYDEDTGMYVAGTPGVRLLALGYIIKDTNGVEYGVWRLKGAMSYPDAEHDTEDDGNESAGETLTYTGQQTVHKFAYKGKPAKAVRIPLAAFPGGEAAFFAAVQTPDTVAAALAGGDDPAPVAASCLYGTPNTGGNIGLRTGESVTLYDGAVLSNIDTVYTDELKKTHPFAFILLTKVFVGIQQRPVAELYCASQYEFIENENWKGQTSIKVTAENHLKYRCYTDELSEWEQQETIDISKGFGDGWSIKWANFDLVNVYGSVAIPASDPIPVSSIVGYSYNGTVFSPLPERDEETYPQVMVTGAATPYSARVCMMSGATTGYGAGNLWCICCDSYIQYYLFNGEWTTNGGDDEYSTICAMTAVKWANFDVLNEDGTVYLSASDPIPVYE